MCVGVYVFIGFLANIINIGESLCWVSLEGKFLATKGLPHACVQG